MINNYPLYAFWRYDLYPYILGAPVEKIEDNGTVIPPSYGGFRYKPFFVTSFKNGVALKAQLENLTLLQKEAINAVNADFGARLDDLKKKYNINK